MIDGGRRSLARTGMALGVAALALAIVAPVVGAASPKTRPVSKAHGVQGNASSIRAGVSASGKFVVFESRSSNLGPDANDLRDIFLKNMATGSLFLISKSGAGVSGNDASSDASVSATGRFVAFESRASNLTPEGNGGKTQIFVRDRKKGKTELISMSPTGDPGDGLSGDPAISPDGRFIAFESRATNLVAKDTMGQEQIYLYDRVKDKLSLVSKNKAGKAGNASSRDPAISADAKIIAYESNATNLTGKDTKGVAQVFMRHRGAKQTRLLSQNKRGKAGNDHSNDPAVSSNGKRVVFESDARNLIFGDTNGEDDIYMSAVGTGRVTRVSKAWNGKQLKYSCCGAEDPDISASGRYIAFDAYALNAIKGGSDGGTKHVFVRDLKTGAVYLASRNGPVGNNSSEDPAISANGKFVAFSSNATNLIKGGDSNGVQDIFRRGPLH